MHRYYRYLLLFLTSFFAVAMESNGQSYVAVGGVAPDTLTSQVQPADFQPSSPVIDSNINVVVLRDSGITEMQGKIYGWRVKHERL